MPRGYQTSWSLAELLEYEKRKKQAAKYTSKSATQSLQEKLRKEQQVRLEVGMNKTSCLLVARYTSSDLADPSALFCGSSETQERAARLYQCTQKTPSSETPLPFSWQRVNRRVRLRHAAAARHPCHLEHHNPQRTVTR